MKLRRFLSITIFSVFVLVGFIYYITIFIFLEDWLGLQTSAGSLNTLIFSVLASFTLFSFLICVFTDPGGVPSGFVPDIEHNDSSDQESKRSVYMSFLESEGVELESWGHDMVNKTWTSVRKTCSRRLGYSQPLELPSGEEDIEFERNVQLSQCEKCSAFKPPRTHHCRVCRRCVLRMDHHCLWINNCVGHRNYKAYVILVFYATLANIYSSVIIVCCALQKDWDFDGKIFLKTFYICCAVMVIGLSLTLGTLFGWHIYLITHNMTTIEYYEAIRAEWLAKKSGQSYRHPFDVGFYRNITLILGPNIVKWLFPTAVSHIKDGLHFPTARDSL